MRAVRLPRGEGLRRRVHKDAAMKDWFMTPLHCLLALFITMAVQGNAAGPTESPVDALATDGGNIYVLRGNRIYRINSESMSVEAEAVLGAEREPEPAKGAVRFPGKKEKGMKRGASCFGITFGPPMIFPVQGETEYRRTLERYCKVSTELGVGIIRNFEPFEFTRFHVQGTEERGKLRLERQDFFIDLTSRYGLSVLPRMSSLNNGPRHTVRGVPRDIDAYKAYLKEMVLRYRDEVTYWQILRENLRGSQYEGHTVECGRTPEQSAYIASITYPIIKELDPDAVVVHGSQPAFPTFQNPSETVDYIDEFLQAGGGDFIDVFGIHLYAEDTQHGILAYQKVLKKNGFTKPVWNLETGSSSRAREINFGGSDDPATQAQMIVKKAAMNFSMGIEKVIKGMIVDIPEDLTRGTMVSGQTGVGVLGPPPLYKKKPSFYTLKLTVAKLDGFTDVKTLSRQDVKRWAREKGKGLNSFKFSFEDREPVWVVWRDDRPQTVDLQKATGWNRVTVTHVIEDENRSIPKCETVPANSVQISASPVFVEQAAKTK